MEISDFVFFADAKSATRYADIINNIVVIRVEREEEKTEEETWADMEDGTLDVGILTEEIEETHEETLPEFIETTEETEEEVTEVVDTEAAVEETKEDTSEIREESTTPEDSVIPDMPIDPGNNERKEGSQAPFVIACIVLALLSISSIATVVVIRAKNKIDE